MSPLSTLFVFVGSTILAGYAIYVIVARTWATPFRSRISWITAASLILLAWIAIKIDAVCGEKSIFGVPCSLINSGAEAMVILIIVHAWFNVALKRAGDDSWHYYANWPSLLLPLMALLIAALESWQARAAQSSFIMSASIHLPLIALSVLLLIIYVVIVILMLTGITRPAPWTRG